ncbi:FAD-dependent oxidoreductase [Sporobacter termitidis]|nr:FAD-dependent oxidoreductase [Sporobacter termitidis]
MSEEKFDVIIVGGGLAGSAAAYTLAKAGLEVLVIERGNYCGAKNMTGGRLYGHSLEKMIPNFAETAPVERKIIKERVTMATGTGAMTIEYGSNKLKDPSCASYSVLRSKFDKWFAEQGEAQGAMYVTGIRVDKLLQKDGRVCGVLAAGDELYSDVVLLADGVNSILAQQIGMKKELSPHQVAVGVKEVIGLDEKTVSDRFGVLPGEGAAWLVAGDPTGGAVGGGFLYTDKESVSIGTVVTLSDIGSGGNIKVPDMVERFKSNPVIAPLIEGGKLLEYSAHLVPEAGYKMIPELVWNGVLIAGDAAGFVMNLGYTIRGMDLAIESGRLAAEAILKAKEKGDFSMNGLSAYLTLLENSFIMRDLRHYQNMPSLMSTPQLFNELPAVADALMRGLFVVDGKTPVKLIKTIVPAINKIGGFIEAGKLGIKAVGAM